MVATKIKIRPIKYIAFGQIDKFLQEVNVAVNSSFSPDNSKKVKGGLLRIFHSFLPLSWRFLQDSYVAKDNKDIIGVIGLLPDSRSKLRWKINQLLLKPNSYEVGKLLIDFIVNKYGAEGVETFITEVDSNDSDALDLFKNASGFRKCTVNTSYLFDLTKNISENSKLNEVRKVSIADSAKLHDLYLECLTPLAKISLEKTNNDFTFNFLNTLKDRLNNVASDSWIMENPEKNSAIAFATMATRDYQTFYINIITSLPYTDYFMDILNYIIKHTGCKNKEASVIITLSEAFQGHNKYAEILKKLELPVVQTNQILVKDYWRPLKERKPAASPIIMFPEGTSPACNSLNIVRK